MLSSRTSLVCGPFVLLLVYIFLRKYVQYKKLSHFGGHWLAGWTHLWLARQVYNNRKPYAEMGGLKTYGSPLRIGPNLLTTDDPDLIRHMTAPRNGDWYDGVKFGSPINSVFSERNEKVHNETRAMEIGAYQMKDVDTVEEDIDRCLLKTIQLLRETYQQKPCDMAELSAWFTLDILSKIAFGQSFGFLEANEDLWEYNALNRQLFAPLEMILSWPLLRNFMLWKPVEALMAPQPTDSKGAGRVIRFARDQISARYARDPKGTETKDFLGHFIRKGLTQAQAEAESRLQLIAGSDSTSAAIRNTLMLIISNTRVFTKLRAEIDQAITQGQLSFPVIRNAEAQKLEYLQACTWEGLRMFPPLFGLLAKASPPKGDTFKDRFYPPGTEVSVCYQALGRRCDIFGLDVDMFRPERFLDADAETQQRRMHTAELIFGSGKYSCLGRNIGFMEQNKFLVEMIRKFDWAVADPHRGSLLIAAGLWVQKDMNLYPQVRSEEV